MYLKQWWDLLELIKELFPLQRMINGKGMDDAFKIIKRELPEVIIHEYPSGSQYGDWIIPEAWEVTEGFIETTKGKLISSINHFQYFVVPYSKSVNGVFTKKELEPHVVTDLDRPDVFPFDTSLAYQFEPDDWKIALPHNTWEDMREVNYKVVIETKLFPNSMKVAEYFKKGEREETIVLSAHIDELCNDDLSGVAVLVELAKWLRNHSTKYSYKILILPELFGSIAYIFENRLENIKCFIQLETMGAGYEWKVISDIREGYGNDERVFGFPTVGVPWMSIQRHPFEEYHSSLDTPDIIKEEYLEDSLAKIKDVVIRSEQDYIPKWKGYLPPWLSKRGLYDSNMRDVPYFINGKDKIYKIREKVDKPYHEVYDYIEKLRKEGLVDAIWED